MEPISLCDTCDMTVDSKGNVNHDPNCLRQKHNKLKDAVVSALKSLGDAIGEAKFGQ